MSINDMNKEDLELLSYKDITNLLLEENGASNTAQLFKTIITLLEMPSSSYEAKIGDYYTMLTTDKRFILLENGDWDLRKRHTSDKIIIVSDEDEEIEDDIVKSKDEETEESSDEYDLDSEEESFDEEDDDLKDLVILDEDELELEQ